MTEFDVINFNKEPFIAGSCAAAGLAVAALVSRPLVVRLALGVGALAAGLAVWIAADAVVATYGRAGAEERWRWIAAAGRTPGRWLNLTTGFDDSTAKLRELVGGEGRAIDMFDASKAHDRPLTRARKAFPSAAPSQPIDDAVTAIAGSRVDSVFLIMSAHESHGTERARLLEGVAGAIRPGGRAIVVEHLRDAPNLMAFGLGALHFSTRQAWMTSASSAGLRCVEEQRLGRLVHGFVFTAGQ